MCFSVLKKEPVYWELEQVSRQERALAQAAQREPVLVWERAARQARASALEQDVQPEQAPVLRPAQERAVPQVP
ncbi:MAG: hypothetical protein WCA91_05825 [Candidatus Acidiferrales bacterium]